MHSDLFLKDLNLVTDKCPIAYLFRFLIQGFIRVYSEDIHQYRLSKAIPYDAYKTFLRFPFSVVRLQLLATYWYYPHDVYRFYFNFL